MYICIVYVYYMYIYMYITCNTYVLLSVFCITALCYVNMPRALAIQVQLPGASCSFHREGVYLSHVCCFHPVWSSLGFVALVYTGLRSFFVHGWPLSCNRVCGGRRSCNDFGCTAHHLLDNAGRTGVETQRLTCTKSRVVPKWLRKE